MKSEKRLNQIRRGEVFRYFMNLDHLQFQAVCKDRLTQKEKRIVAYRIGFDTKQIQSLSETGEYFGLTRERIRQIEYMALRKLERNPCKKLQKKL